MLLVVSFPVHATILSIYCLQYHRFILDPLSLLAFTILMTLLYLLKHRLTGCLIPNIFYYLVRDKIKILVYNNL
jgi:hypothetical protein